MVTILPDQRVSLAEKQKDSWYVNNIHYWIDLAMYSNDKKFTADNIDAGNGVITPDMYEYALNPLSADSNKVKNLPGVIREVDFITPIREKNIGEYIELPHHPLVKVDDPDVTMMRSQAVASEVRPLIEQQLINLINQQQSTGIPNQEVPDIEAEAKRIAQQWVDDRAIKAQKLLEWINDNNYYDEVRTSAFNYWWCTEEIYLRSFIQGNDVMYEIIEPLQGFPISNGNEFVDDHDAFMIRRKISINRILEYHGDKLSDKDYNYLQDIIRNSKGPMYTVDVAVIEDTYGRKVFNDDGKRVGRNKNWMFSNSTDIFEYTVYFKTQVKRKILTGINQLGEVTTRVVESNYKLNPDAGDINIESVWLDEVWTQVLLGEFYGGIYLKPEPIPAQIYDSKGHVKLPVTGKKGLLNGLYVNPIPRRIAPNQALFRIITLQIERQMAKYKGAVEIIPQSMLLGGEDADPQAAYFYRLADNTIIYDDAKVDPTTVQQGYRIVGNDAVSSYIKTLIDIREAIKAEAWEMANMNDSRAGEAATSSTVTNNQQNIFRAKLGSVLMVSTFNQVLTRMNRFNLELAKIAYSEGITGGYFGTDGKVHHFNINSHELTNNTYGLFITNSVIEHSKLEEYKKLAFSAAQNGDFALASKAIDSDNVSEIRTYVDEFTEARDNFNKEMEQKKLAQEKQISDAQIANDKANRDHDIVKIDTEQEHITNRELKLQAMESNNATDK